MRKILNWFKWLLGTLFAWIADGLSLDESKVSLLMIGFGLCLFIDAVYLLWWRCDIPANLYGLNCILAAILGTNTVINSDNGVLDKAITLVKGKIGI